MRPSHRIFPARGGRPAHRRAVSSAPRATAPRRHAGPWITTGLALLLAIASAAAPRGSQAQQSRPATPPPDSTPAMAPDSTADAPVVIGTDTLFHLHGGLGPFTASDRAAAIMRHLDALSASIADGRDSIIVVDTFGRSELRVGPRVVMTVVDADTAGMSATRNALAQRYARVLTVAVERARHEASVRALIVDSVKAVLVTALLVLLLRAMAAVFVRIYARLERWRGSVIPSIRIQRLELLSSERITTTLTAVARGLRIALTLLLFYFYVPLVLSFFPWTAPLASRIVGYAISPIVAAWTAFTDYLPNLFYLAVIVLITRYVLKFVHFVFRAIGGGAITLQGFHPDWAEPTYKILRALLLAFAVVVMFPYLPGSDSNAFKGISLFLGLLLSIGSSSAIANMIAGLVLTYTRAFQIGDRVKIDETVGDVIERTLLVTRVRTIKNVEITIPNGMVLSQHVVNYSARSGAGPEAALILNTSVTIGYDVPWRHVHQLLCNAALATEHIVAEPAPFVLQTALDDHAVSYELNAYTDAPGRMATTYSALHASIQDAFNRAGVEILSPRYASVRDGNSTTVPPEFRPAGYEAPGFGVRTVSGSGVGGNGAAAPPVGEAPASAAAAVGEAPGVAAPPVPAEPPSTASAPASRNADAIAPHSPSRSTAPTE